MDHTSDRKLEIVCSNNHKSRIIATIYRHHPELRIVVTFKDKAINADRISMMRGHAKPTPDGYNSPGHNPDGDPTLIAKVHANPHTTYTFGCKARDCANLDPVKLTDANIEKLFEGYKEVSRATCELSSLRVMLHL